MQSYIIQGTNPEDLQNKVADIVKGSATGDFIYYHIEKDTDKKSLGIEKIKEVKQILATKPKDKDLKIIIIHDASDLTIPAQNSLLKTLEEPPKFSMIFLLTRNKDLLLKTVLSRCAVITLKNSFIKTAQELLLDTCDSEALDYFANNPKVFESSKSAIEFLEQVEIDLAKNKNPESYKLLRSIYKNKEALLSTNASPRLVLENIYLCR